MENKLFGFLIDEETLLDITKRRLVRFTDTSSVNSMTIRVVSLNVTMARLLTLLLITGSETIISKDDILNNVWEGHNLSSSSQRLWHAINELRKKLSAVGISDDFILNVRDAGYSINNQYTVTSLFLG
ncbi:winged helix-turn-helix domain-containing protein [Serratia fonticola]|jgi:DNA-binding winged helix-turn-helix (wHTH) protein|uniref:winged helix-turn-helix domain-containing protein n=1 Tax=Serratia fonticola TaxID=47917 RepID=UPI00192A816C|nr:helix-turn-helix domain-containing protein [Serratia fonticola]MBL5862723.1 winged helix-turn-helix domain-containing protein [Serratia fonticola]